MEACSIDGIIKIEMRVLPDVYGVPCEICEVSVTTKLLK